MITFAILNYNGENLIRDCLKSVIKQAGDDDEVLVFDNASTDQSCEIIKKEFPKVRLIANPVNGGYVYGVNQCFIHAKFENVVHLSNDVILNDFHFYAGGENNIYQPLVLSKDGSIDNAGMDYKWPGYGIGRKKKWWKNVVEEIPFATMTCFAAKRQTIIDGGFFNQEFYPAYYEDVDFYLRNKGKIKYWLISNRTVTHLGSVSFHNKYRQSEIKKMYQENQRLLINKHYKGYQRFFRLRALDLIREGQQLCNAKDDSNSNPSEVSSK